MENSENINPAAPEPENTQNLEQNLNTKQYFPSFSLYFYD